MNDKHMKIIAESQLFDVDFYNKKYEDVGRRGNDPLRHFVRHGYREGRMPNVFFDTKYYKNKYLSSVKDINPLIHYITSENSANSKTSELFDGEFYLSENPDVLLSGMNPLSHFLEFGIAEGRKAIPSIQSDNYKSGNIHNFHDVRLIKTTIVIPVYNAIDEVLECIDSVLLNTELDSSVDILILNDASPDKRVKRELGRYKNVDRLTIKNGLFNIGYTRNANKGLAYAKGRDVVLLNSDTIVSPNWLRNLKLAAYSERSIGTVTAVSNNAGSFSVPVSGTNVLPEGLTINQIGRSISASVACNYIHVPTGNGFCLYIKRALINDVGNFDKISFPKGYGEENDFCMRALSRGWANIVDPSTYIYHVRSASFKESKDALIKAGVAEVKRKFPEYEGAIKAIAQSIHFKDARQKTSELLTDLKPTSKLTKPKIMFVISTRTGGTPQTNKDLMIGIQDIYDCYVLASNGREIEIMQVVEGEYKEIETIKLKEFVKFATHKSAEYDDVLKNILVRYAIELLHIRHIAWHSLNLPHIAKSLSIPVINSFHDFYCVCPTVNLIDKLGELHLFGVKSNGTNPLWNDETVYEMNERSLIHWHNIMRNAFSDCDAYVTTSQSTKTIIMQNYVVANSGNNFHVIPHGRDFDGFVSKVDELKPKNKLKILLPGNISPSKGKELVKQIKDLDVDDQIEFHLLGNCDVDLLDYVINHGRYIRNEFQMKVKKIAPDIAAVLSIWPETYCHTLTESWASGIPVIGVSFGAVEERISKHGGGWLVKPDAKLLYEKLVEILNEPAQINEKNVEIKEWQNGYGLENTIASMATNYLALYQSVLINKFDAGKACSKKLGFIMKGQFPSVPATAYVRLIDWKTYFESRYNMSVESTTWQSMLTTEVLKFSKVVIQRDAIPRDDVWRVLGTLKRFGIPYIYEIDDDLLEVPQKIDTDGVYLAYRPYIKTLITGAEEVHVTNESLKAICNQFNDNILIRPNKIHPTRWLPCQSEEKSIDLNLPLCDLKVLYFGSKTHQEDLDFIIQAIKLARKSGKNIHLFVIGIGENLTEGDGFTHRLSPPSGRYDVFVDWMISIRGNFDMGVAPLVDLEFSKSKSYLKVLEFQALGLPVICSDNSPYSELKDTEMVNNVMFIENSVPKWSEMLINYRTGY
jgi:GT2 family glycosyltransferase/glycosyltransferase involved in cell wall biosynthesis